MIRDNILNNTTQLYRNLLFGLQQIMNKFILSLVLLCVIARAKGLYHKGGKIIGGEAAIEGQFPGIVSLRYLDTGLHFCGGAIIAADVIVTAAHCLNSASADNIEAVAGSIYLSKGGVRVQARDIVYHEKYDLEFPHNDIGLVLLETPLSYTSDIQPLRIGDAEPGELVTALGWGMTTYPDGGRTDELQWLQGDIADSRNCSKVLMNGITDGQICFGGETGKGLCTWDSGSPLVKQNNITVGIVSYGRPCAVGYPDVFTRISFYSDWIDSKVSRHISRP